MGDAATEARRGRKDETQGRSGDPTSPFGYVTPAEFEEEYYRSREKQVELVALT